MNGGEDGDDDDGTFGHTATNVFFYSHCLMISYQLQEMQTLPGASAAWFPTSFIFCGLTRSFFFGDTKKVVQRRLTSTRSWQQKKVRFNSILLKSQSEVDFSPHKLSLQTKANLLILKLHFECTCKRLA